MDDNRKADLGVGDNVRQYHQVTVAIDQLLICFVCPNDHQVTNLVFPDDYFFVFFLLQLQSILNGSYLAGNNKWLQFPRNGKLMRFIPLMRFSSSRRLEK